ncbi:hypothetical protein AB0D04_04445 [Streptomyces sp. NPDC048483]|uniref:hypothetical protein n=1 Tax=Streptomyces sp. NPDC048483 TaxID=3154927 RepID=UPI0034133D1D
MVDGGKAGGSNGAAGGGSATSGPTGKAFAAFVRGTWKVEWKDPGDDKITGTARIDDGTWSITFPDEEPLHGTWSLQGSQLALQAPESPDRPESLHDAAVTNVPATVGDSVSLTMPWQPPGAPDAMDGQKLDVTCNSKDGVLRIRHIEESGSTTVHTCTRM